MCVWFCVSSCVCVCVYLNIINWNHGATKLQAQYSYGTQRIQLAESGQVTLSYCPSMSQALAITLGLRVLTGDWKLILLKSFWSSFERELAKQTEDVCIWQKESEAQSTKKVWDRGRGNKIGGRVDERAIGKVWIRISRTRRSPAIYLVGKRFCPTCHWTRQHTIPSDIFRLMAPRWPKTGFMRPLSIHLKITLCLDQVEDRTSMDLTCFSKIRTCFPVADKLVWDSMRRATLPRSTVWNKLVQEHRNRRGTTFRSTRGCNVWTRTAVSFYCYLGHTVVEWVCFTIRPINRVATFYGLINHY